MHSTIGVLRKREEHKKQNNYILVSWVSSHKYFFWYCNEKQQIFTTHRKIGRFKAKQKECHCTNLIFYFEWILYTHPASLKRKPLFSVSQKFSCGLLWVNESNESNECNEQFPQIPKITVTSVPKRPIDWHNANSIQNTR